MDCCWIGKSISSFSNFNWTRDPNGLCFTSWILLLNQANFHRFLNNGFESTNLWSQSNILFYIITNIWVRSVTVVEWKMNLTEFEFSPMLYTLLHPRPTCPPSSLSLSLSPLSLSASVLLVMSNQINWAERCDKVLPGVLCRCLLPSPSHTPFSSSTTCTPSTPQLYLYCRWRRWF